MFVLISPPDSRIDKPLANKLIWFNYVSSIHTKTAFALPVTSFTQSAFTLKYALCPARTTTTSASLTTFSDHPKSQPLDISKHRVVHRNVAPAFRQRSR